MHDTAIIGIPLIAILAGILFNRNDSRELRAEMEKLRAEMYKRFDAVDHRLDGINADLRQFYHLTGKMEGRIDEIAKRSLTSVAPLSV